MSSSSSSIIKSTLGLAALGLVAFAALVSRAVAGDDLSAVRQQRARALQALAHRGGDEPLTKFLDEELTPELVQATSREEILERLRKIRTAGARAGEILVQPIGDDEMRITMRDEGHGLAVTMRVERAAPHRIAALALEELSGDPAAEADLGPRITWDNLAASLRASEKAGFSGVVLVVRDDKIVVHEGLGLANREKKIPNTIDTIFAIGSVPIDFTKAAVLKLEEMGALKTSDPITKFLVDVPADKRAITIDHLMTGRSGLPNFHHIPGVDADPDLTWIDRATAIKRILGQELLFRPGEDRAHSHSAWGLLAAIVEIVSGKTYEEFLGEHFFGPAGIQRTGDHHSALAFDEDEVAVGYGPTSSGKTNSPGNWGETSWLVKGSGGMVSNPGDLYKWVSAIRAGDLLSAVSQKKFWTGGSLAGGDDRGFLCVYTEGPGTMVFLCSNSQNGRADEAQKLSRRLVALVMAEKGATRKAR